MKKIFVLVLVLAAALTACAPDPVALAQADAIRARAEQDSADRAAARENPPVVTVQPPAPESPLPWLLSACLGGGIVATILTLILAIVAFRAAGSLGANVNNPQPPAPKIIIDRVGRGRYRITDNTGSRLLDWNNPVDVRLLEVVNYE
jgi:hypothetical protein